MSTFKLWPRIRKAALLACSAATAASMLACSTADTHESEPAPEVAAQASMRLVARAEYGGSSALEFYEADEGTLLEVEKGIIGDHPNEPAGLDPVQRYEFLTQQKAPLALIEAALRAGNPGHENDPIPQPVTEKERVSKEWFHANYCNYTDSTSHKFDYDKDWTWDKRVEYMKAGVRPWSGFISAKIGYYGGSIPDQWYGLEQDNYIGFRQTSRINRRAYVYVRDVNTDTNPRPYDIFADVFDMCVNYHP